MVSGEVIRNEKVKIHVTLTKQSLAYGINYSIHSTCQISCI